MMQKGLSGQRLFKKKIPVQPIVSTPCTGIQFTWSAKQGRHQLPRRFHLLDHSPCIAVQIPGVTVFFDRVIPVNAGAVSSMSFTHVVMMVGVMFMVLRSSTGDHVTRGGLMVMHMWKGVMHHREYQDEQHQLGLYSIVDMHRKAILGKIAHFSNRSRRLSTAHGLPCPGLTTGFRYPDPPAGGLGGPHAYPEICGPSGVALRMSILLSSPGTGKWPDRAVEGERLWFKV
jgi:hypothetical protein